MALRTSTLSRVLFVLHPRNAGSCSSLRSVHFRMPPLRIHLNGPVPALCTTAPFQFRSVSIAPCFALLPLPSIPIPLLCSALLLPPFFKHLSLSLFLLSLRNRMPPLPRPASSTHRSVLPFSSVLLVPPPPRACSCLVPSLSSRHVHSSTSRHLPSATSRVVLSPSLVPHLRFVSPPACRHLPSTIRSTRIYLQPLTKNITKK